MRLAPGYTLYRYADGDLDERRYRVTHLDGTRAYLGRYPAGLSRRGSVEIEEGTPESHNDQTRQADYARRERQRTTP